MSTLSTLLPFRKAFRMEGRTDRGPEGRTDGRMEGRMDGSTDGRADGWTDGRADGWTDGRTARIRGLVVKQTKYEQMDAFNEVIIIMGDNFEHIGHHVISFFFQFRLFVSVPRYLSLCLSFYFLLSLLVLLSSLSEFVCP